MKLVDMVWEFYDMNLYCCVEVVMVLDDDQFVNVIEEFFEDEQVFFIIVFDFDRVVDIFEEMDFDDVVDLIKEFFDIIVYQLLVCMEFDDVDDVCFLMVYDEFIVGVMMIFEFVIVVVDVIVVDVLVLVCNEDIILVEVFMVFVCCFFIEIFIGCYLGVVYV